MPAILQFRTDDPKAPVGVTNAALSKLIGQVRSKMGPGHAILQYQMKVGALGPYDLDIPGWGTRIDWSCGLDERPSAGQRLPFAVSLEKKMGQMVILG